MKTGRISLSRCNLLCHFWTDSLSQYVTDRSKDSASFTRRKQLHNQVALAIYAQKCIFLCVTKLTVSFFLRKKLRCVEKEPHYIWLSSVSSFFAFFREAPISLSLALFFVIQICGSSSHFILAAFLNVVFVW